MDWANFPEGEVIQLVLQLVQSVVSQLVNGAVWTLVYCVARVFVCCVDGDLVRPAIPRPVHSDTRRFDGVNAKALTFRCLSIGFRISFGRGCKPLGALSLVRDYIPASLPVFRRAGLN